MTFNNKKKIIFRNISLAAILVLCVAAFVACNDASSGRHSHAEEENHAHEKDERSHQEESHAHKGEKDAHEKSEGEDHAHEEGGHEHEGGEFGKGKGVAEYDEKRGIVLAPIAEKRLGIGFRPLRSFAQTSKAYRIPLRALIYEENLVGVYVKEGEWLRFVEVRVLKRGSGFALIEGSLPSHSLLVTEAAPLLRLAELNAAGASGEGHGH